MSLQYDKCGLPVHDASNVHIPDSACQRVPNHGGKCERYSRRAAEADGVCFYCRASIGTPHAMLADLRCPEDCAHEHVLPHVADQTLGVYCVNCGLSLGVCWMDDHFSEALWNRACAYAHSLPVTGDPKKDWHDAKPCEQNREDVCAICGASMTEVR